jgi:hypothetical protein
MSRKTDRRRSSTKSNNLVVMSFLTTCELSGSYPFADVAKLSDRLAYLLTDLR